MINKEIYCYALAKAMYEKKKDYIDTYCIFILKILPIDKTLLDLKSVENKVENKFNINIPEVSLKSIITRAKKYGYLLVEKKQRIWHVKITDKGIGYINGLQPESVVKGKINELFKNILDYIKHNKLKEDKISEVLLSVIDKNIELLREYFSPHSRPLTDSYIEKKSGFEKKILGYIKWAEKNKPNSWEMLRNIVYGSIIATAAFSKNISVIDKKFENVKIFLDSNFIFSLLDLHYLEINKATKELFSLLKSYKFSLNVFDFTIEEMIKVLSNYPRKQNIYYKDIKVNSIYSNLKSKGYTFADIREFIRKIESKLWELGITIFPTDIELNNYYPEQSQISKMIQYKPKIGDVIDTYNHDFAAIEKIREIRKIKIREIEKSIAIFLSSDLKLAKYNYIEMNHRIDFTISEVIPDRLLANILWLKNPTIKENIPMDTIISIYSEESMITREIWEKFFNNIDQLKKEGRVQDIDIASLFYDNQIEDTLMTLDASDIDDFTANEMFKNIQQQLADLEKEKEAYKKKIEEDEKEKEEDKKELEKESIKNQKLIDYYNSRREKLEQKAKKIAKLLSYIIVTIPFLLLFIVLIITKTPLIFHTFAAVLTVLYFTLLIYFKIDFRNIRSNLETWLFNILYKKYISVDELEIPINILNRRYAKGEIDKKEYLEKKKDLEK